MIRFTDTPLFVRGICSAQLADISTGDVLFSSNKYQSGNITCSVNADPLRAGLNNPIATVIESDPDIQVNFTQADFNLNTKMAAVGAHVTYNAVVPVCQVVTAKAETLSVDVTDGAPAASYGMDRAVCYVQEVGAASKIATGGTAYDISEAGAITGFTAVSGKQYKVWYYTRKMNAAVGTLTSAMNGKIGIFTAQLAVYSNVNAKTNEGTRCGWLYIHVPLKLQADGATVTGDQSTYDTTAIVGRAISNDSGVISGTCEDCAESTLAWYVLALEDGVSVVTGLVAQIGGVISVPKSGNAQVQPKAVVANGQLVNVAPAKCTYNLTGGPDGTTVDAKGVIKAGATAGEGQLTVTLEDGGEIFTDKCTVSVTG